MPKEFTECVAGVAALAEPARRSLYEYVVAQPDAVSRDQAAAGTGVALHSVKFHLDRLVEAGLLETEFRRLTARRGPGAGRPAKLYRRAVEDVAVSLPPRHYDVAGRIMARSLERAEREGRRVGAVTRDEALSEGRRIGAATASEGEQAARIVVSLSDCGYEPRATGDEVILTNCPFHALAQDHTALICGINEALVAGILEGIEASDWKALLEPESGHCCVKARRVERG